MPDMPQSKGNRLTIFVLPSEKEVRRLANDKTGFISGFYKGRAAASVAYIPRRMENADPGSTNLILLHEYAHHLMAQDLASPYPEWLVEGFAEFMSTAKFERDGSVGLGPPAHHRAYGLIAGNNLPFEVLLANQIGTVTVEQRESIYGRGWLLTHYLTFEPSRKGQVDAYVRAIAQGQEPLIAARTAFGDLKQLERELNRYVERRMPYLKVEGPALNVGRIDVVPLSAGASLAVPLLAELKNDADKTTAEPLAAKLRQIRSTYPGDPFVEVALAAADRALAADPSSTEAMILKGRAMVEKLGASSGTPEVAAARQWFLKANKLDPEDPEPLYEFYRSYVLAGIRPTPNALAALHYASDLAPQDLSLRLNSAMAYLHEGKLKEARNALASVAYNPHGGGASAAAKKMIQKIDGGNVKGAMEAVQPEN